MEGFLSLEQAAEQLESSVPELSRQIEEGQVVAIIRDGVPWLSNGEVARYKKSSQSSDDPAPLHVEVPLPDLPLPPTPEPVAEAPEQTTPEEPEPAEAEVNADPDDIKELLERNRLLSQRNEELERTLKRLKSGLQETEATLRRSRTARTNLENDVVELQEKLKGSNSRIEGLEREIQSLSIDLERAQDERQSDYRRHRSKDRGAEEAGPGSELDALRNQMREKDRLIAQEYEERATMRSQLETNRQKYFELKALYDKEKAEWSEILAREIQYQSQLKQQLEELRPKSSKGWNPFRRER